jgi:uncharacterized membrane protein
MLSKTLGPLWVVLLGIIVMFAFFAALGLFSPADVLWLTAGVAIVLILFGIRSLMMRRHMGTHGNQDLFRSLNHLRERRGF